MRKLGSIAAILTALIMVTACSGQPAPTATGGGETPAGQPLRIVLVSKANASDYWTAVKRGAMQAGSELGVEVVFLGPDTESEPDKQLNQLQTAVNERPAGIGFAPQDGAQDGAPEILQAAQAAGIPVVVFDTPLSTSEIPIATIASNNKAIGALAAENMARLTGGQGKIAIVAHGVLGTAAERRDGFKEYIEANTQMEIVDIQNGESDQAKSRDKAAGILTAHPDLVGFFGTDDDSVIAIAEEVAGRNLLGQVVVVGVDASPDEITLVAEGMITGAVAQNPAGIGYLTVQVLVDAANGTMPTQREIISEAVWYTADNLNTPEVAAILGTN
ncbi:MAG: substrate-binding domain-containing protein [Propionibacteriaceae bacterium]|nr:substrate-binding domain-containing protein [Propionibacteriaceae bacterium]